MVKSNRRRASDEQEDFGAVVENFSDEDFEDLCRMVAEERQRRGLDDEPSDWSSDYRRARRKARDVEPGAFPDDDEDDTLNMHEVEDRGRLMRKASKDRRMSRDMSQYDRELADADRSKWSAHDSQLAYDARYDPDPVRNLAAYRQVAQLRRQAIPVPTARDMALDASRTLGRFVEKFPSAVRFMKKSKPWDLPAMKGPERA